MSRINFNLTPTHSPHQHLNFDLARQSPIEALRSERGSPSQIEKGDEEDRLGKVAAGQNSNVDAGCGIFPIIERVASFAEKEFAEGLDRAEKLDKERIQEREPLERIERTNIKPLRLSVRFQNGKVINLEKGKFNGDVSKAMVYLQDFFNHAIAESHSYGWGYGDLIINGQKYHITPYGIDIEMMLGFCGGKSAKDFPVSDNSENGRNRARAGV